jgi:signal transduction histidine kinase
VVTAPLFTAQFLLQDHPSDTVAPPLTALGSYDRLAPLWTFAELRTLAVVAAGLLALVVRYRRGDERLRRQLLWLVLAVVVVLAAITPWSLIAGTPIVVLFSIPLIPAAMTVAILRHQLLDIRLVVSRTILYALLTAGAVGVYAALVAASDSVLHQKSGAGSSAAAAVFIAICFNPVRIRLQRTVDRVLYGDRTDPVRAVSRVGERLGTGLPGVLDAVREALRLPFAALRVDNAEVAVSGTAPELSRTIPLAYNGERIGELVVGLRSGENRLDSADQAVFELLAAPLAAAVHATTLSGELQRSREGLVVAREDERRRLRRDLHDGLGAALTGIAFKADAVGNLIAADPDEARRLVAELRTETAQAIGDIRRLVYGLRPPALDDLGLVGAVRQAATRLSHEGVTVRVAAPDRLPALSAAVEAAAYRIATEALTNAVRHSGGDRVEVRIHADGQLHVEVADDGPTGGQDGDARWRPGVGLSSIRERAAELGGTCVAGPGPDGGLVLATLPLEAS